MTKRTSFIRILLIVLGTASLALGVIGIFLPLLPTTPFLLLSAFLYHRSSPQFYRWLLAQPFLGKYIRNYRENKIIPLRAKIVSLVLLWATILYCLFFVLKNPAVKILLAAVLLGVTFHILSFKSRIK